jgi:hypothetical protein
MFIKISDVYQNQHFGLRKHRQRMLASGAMRFDLIERA